MTKLLAAALFLLAAGATAQDAELPLLLEEDFEKGADRWEPTDPKAWKILETAKGKVYRLDGASSYKPPHRSPFSIALLKDVTVGDFVLEVKVQSTGKDVPHRDLCFIYGYQDPAHFYYTHIAKKADDHANQIFIVNDAPRKKISAKSTAGTNWTDGWHPVKIVRKVADGTIEVYFDDMATPIMKAEDKTFTWGRVGLGSFDDTGNFDDVRLRGVKAERK